MRGEVLAGRVAVMTGQLRDSALAFKSADLARLETSVEPAFGTVREFVQLVRTHIGSDAPAPLSATEFHRCRDPFKEFSTCLSKMIESLQRHGARKFREVALEVRSEADTPEARDRLGVIARLADALDKAAEELILLQNEFEHRLRYHLYAEAPPPAPFPAGKIDELREHVRDRKALLENPLVAPIPSGPPASIQSGPQQVEVRDFSREYTPMKRTGTRLVAERFLPDEVIFECEQCGGGMTERTRKGGLNVLVCGYCRHERELSAPAKAPVAWHDFSAAKQNLSALLKPAEGITSWTCSECGADVDSASEKMVGRCAYCGSSDFVRLDAMHGVLQPQGLQRFACDAKRAEWLLREWLKRRRDAVARFHREFNVVAVEARYVPYWILDIEVPGRGSVVPRVSIQNVHACASRQLLQRMPSELRAIEPFETRMLPPFRPEQLAGTVCERFTVDLDEAWRHVHHQVEMTLERDHPLNNYKTSLRNAEISFKYLMLPVYFFVLEWNGVEYHALMDGAGDGVGIQYPASRSRVLVRRARWAAGLLALIGLFLTAAFLAERRAEEHERFEQQQLAELHAEIAEQNRKTREDQAQLEKKKREREAAEAAGSEPVQPEPAFSEDAKALQVLAASPVDVRSWFSDPLDVTLPVRSDTRVEAEGSINLRLRVQLEISTSSVQALEYMRLLRDPQNHQLLQQLAVATVQDSAYYKLTGPGVDRDTRLEMQEMVSAVLGLTPEEGYWPYHNLRLVNLTLDAQPSYTGTFRFSLGTAKELGKGRSLQIEMKMDPLDDPLRFCELTSEYRIDYKCWMALRDFTDGSGNVDTVGAVPKLQEIVDELLRDRLDGEWVGAVTVTSVLD